jgi:hypothetical protein
MQSRLNDAGGPAMPGLPQLPMRPLTVHAPGVGLRAQLWVAFWSLAVAAALGFFIVPLIGDLASDYSLVGKAQPVADARVHGSCSTHGGVLTRCSATLVARGESAEIERKVDYFFVDFHPGSYEVAVIADPARPALLTTDLALDKLTNRLVTLALAGPLFASIIVLILLGARRTLRTQRATSRALSNQVLRPVLLRMESYALGDWHVSPAPNVLAREWRVPRRARPIVMDPDRKLVLGVTSGDGAISMPLDRELRWIGLDAAERSSLLDQLGPDRLGGWLAALTRGADDAERARLRRRMHRIAVAGLIIGALAAIAAWLAFSERETGTGELVTLQRGDETSQSKTVRLRGTPQRGLAAKTSHVEGNASHLEVWVPMTAPDWKPGAPVTWIVQDPSYGIGDATTFSGTVSDAPLPERATTELRRHGIELAPTVRRLDAVLPPPDPLHMPALVAFFACLALSLSLLLGALGLRFRIGRMEKIRS